jgi:hypothetical protein
MSEGASIAVLVVGLLIVLVDGQLILWSSPAYLAEAYHDPARAKRVSQLVTVLFHLVMFGVVALVASVGFHPGGGLGSVLTRVGILLLLTAAGHGATLGVLSRVRDGETSAELAEEQIAASAARREHPEDYKRP